MPTFRLALSGDFLNVEGRDACGELPMHRLDACKHIEYRFLPGQAPRPGDLSYFRKFYSLKTTPADLAGLDGYVVLRPHVPREALAAAAETLTAIGRSGAGYEKVD